MDLDALSESPDGERRITTTARALMLVRDVQVQRSDEAIYDAERGGHHLPHWDHDTTFGGLGLTAAAIADWRGRRVLDVACGLGLAGTELSELGVAVDGVDLELGDDHPSLAIAARHVRQRYAEQMRALRALVVDDDPRYRMTDDERGLLERLVGLAERIADRYPSLSGRRVLTDARELAPLADASYDAVLCGWLMVHLGPEDERRVVEAMLRVAKPGATVHVKAGYGGEAAERVRPWIEARATVVHAKDDLVVLRRLG